MFLSFSLLLVAITALQAGLQAGDLTCEYVVDPAVVDVRQPRLAWINTAGEGERGQRQTAYQIRVATSEAALSDPDLWDSKKVNSDQSTRVLYGGKALASRQECWWQVRVWDRKGKASAWSRPARWRMGILEANEWKATWIGAPWQGEAALPKPQGPQGTPAEMPPPAPFLRKSFLLNKPVRKAVAFVTGLGYFEFYVNGQKVGDDVLVPNQTNYAKRPELPRENIPLPDDFRVYKVMYLAYDITEKLRSGENVFGSVLGNGFYNAAKYWAGSYGTPRFLGQVHITYADGTEEVIVSDESWKAAKGPILMDMVFYGEHYDARLEQAGWAAPGFDDTVWEPVAKRKAPEGKLVAHTPHPDRIMERLTPVKIENRGPGRYFVDFGVEISGWLRLNNVQGPAGHKIEIKYLSNQYSGDNTYVFRGEGPESYAARFNWFVFSAVTISNWPGELRPEHLTAEAVNTYIEESATFETSNSLFNDINRIWKRSQLDNMHGGLASDCPHRERSGYTGDGQVACVTVMHNYDAQSFYHKWIADMYESQIASTGYVPNGAPWQPGCGGGVAWGAAICIMPWEFYLHYGAKDMLSDNYEAMKGYVRYLQNWMDEDGIVFSQAQGRDGKPLRWMNLGEWSWPGEQVPDELVHTFYFWRCAGLTAQTAAALGKNEEARSYTELARQSWEAFHKRFYDGAKGTYGKGGGDIFALRMGVPKDRYTRVLASLKANLAAHDGHLDTGIFGTQFFFEVLAENGMQQEAYAALNKRTQPSFGYWLEQGATTTREDWDSSGSHNHPMFGGGLVWFYRKLAGMSADPEEPGYRHIIFRPQPVPEMSTVVYYNRTPYGKAGISWENTGETFAAEITVPVGSRATVYVPASGPDAVQETGSKRKRSREVVFRKMEDGYAVYSVPGGQYTFKVKK